MRGRRLWPGCKGASKRAGFGPIAKLKDQEFIQAQQNYENLNSQLQSARQHLAKAQSVAAEASGHTLAQQQTQARGELPGLQKQYNTLEAQLKKNEAQAEGAVEGNVAFSPSSGTFRPSVPNTLACGLPRCSLPSCFSVSRSSR